jgi:hypothetical protein
LTSLTGTTWRLSDEIAVSPEPRGKYVRRSDIPSVCRRRWRRDQHQAHDQGCARGRRQASRASMISWLVTRRWLASTHRTSRSVRSSRVCGLIFGHTYVDAAYRFRKCFLINNLIFSQVQRRHRLQVLSSAESRAPRRRTFLSPLLKARDGLLFETSAAVTSSPTRYSPPSIRSRGGPTASIAITCLRGTHSSLPVQRHSHVLHEVRHRHRVRQAERASRQVRANVRPWRIAACFQRLRGD